MLGMSKITLQQKMNREKNVYLQELKAKGVFITYCSKRGYIYEVFKDFKGYVARVVVALKNGVLHVLDIEPVEVAAA